ncbi:MAG: saccharopine dehydrogenase family protein [Cyanophyceae cyanobacterium]
MIQTVLILGGRGRIGRSVAADVAKHTDAEIIVTTRQALPEAAIAHAESIQILPLELADRASVRAAIAQCSLVIHCAGPFHYRDEEVIKACIEAGVDYIDVSDHRSYYEKAIAYREQATAAGVTAILNTGIFPGISNSMVRQGVEQLDQVDKIHLSYIVAGSGGAGITVMRTTFLGLRKTFNAWIDGRWQAVSPYSDRETVAFPQPYGKTGVYWFDMPETYTFAESFPVKTVVTKFGSVPDFYNHLTWITAHIFPSAWIESSQGIEFFSNVSHRMTAFTDRFSGIGVAMRAEIIGAKGGQETRFCSTMVHENTAVAAGYGTGSVAQLMLAGKLSKPGIWPVEQALPTALFEETMNSRGVRIEGQLS